MYTTHTHTHLHTHTHMYLINFKFYIQVRKYFIGLTRGMFFQNQRIRLNLTIKISNGENCEISRKRNQQKEKAVNFSQNQALSHKNNRMVYLEKFMRKRFNRRCVIKPFRNMLHTHSQTWKISLVHLSSTIYYSYRKKKISLYRYTLRLHFINSFAIH